MFVSGRMLIQKMFKNALRILMNFLCIYLGEKRGGALMHVYVWEHIVCFYYRTA